jgi:hypothetical protein
MSQDFATTVVVGPKSRLGRMTIERSGTPETLAVARDQADVDAVLQATGLPLPSVVDAAGGALRERLAAGHGPILLVVATLGPVHPEIPATTRDAAAVTRDLGFVEQVLQSGRPVHVVLVSTILALAPGDDRRYYGGWKGVVEQQLQQLVDQQATGSRATLTVLYPGRLLDATERRGKLRLHTSYQRLAGLATSSSPERGTGRTVGADARIWLWAASTKLALRSLKAERTRSVPRADPDTTVSGQLAERSHA